MDRLSDRLVGHDDVFNALLRAKNQGKLASTLLFAGPAGIGKRLAALSLAQALICERRSETACGDCGSCIRVAHEQSESLLQVSPEGAGIKIEQARDVLQFIALQKLGAARVVIVDQAHLMNPQAANALLKSLEEPPPGTYFILVTPNPAAVLPTIRSRSQLVRFRPLSRENLKSVLKRLDIKSDDWLLDGAQGSLEVAQRLTESREDYQELEEVTASYLGRALVQFPGEEISKLRDLLKDKSAQAYFHTLVQGTIRDSLRLQANVAPAGHPKGPWRPLSEKLFGSAPGRVAKLAERSLGMETDMSRNVDRGLVLENFALDLRKS